MAMPSDTARRRPSWRRVWAFRAAGLLVALVVALGLAELAVHWLGLAPPWCPPARTALVLHYADPTDTIRLAPHWEGYVSYVWTTINADGFRDRVYSREPPAGVIRVAVLGDSYTMGDGVALEDTYTKQLEARLSASRACEVVNCGVSATNSTNQLGLLGPVLSRYRPRIVVLGYNVNDFYYARETRFQVLERAGYRLTIQGDGRVGVEGPNLTGVGRLKQAIRERSYLYRWLAGLQVPDSEPRSGRARVSQWMQQGGHEKSLAAVADMKRLCDGQGASFLVAILPDLLNAPADARSMDDYPFVDEHRMIVERLRQRHIDCLDLLPAFAARDPRRLAAHPFDRHFNAHGHAIIAEALLPRLEAAIDAAARDPKTNGSAPTQ